jgi:putative acetyltransferase
MPPETRIRRATAADRERLFEVWRRAARATHHFVSPEDLDAFEPLVRDYLISDSEFWVVCDASELVMGFMGLSGNRLESLFLAPDFHRLGAGRRLVRHAHALRGELTVDVNEQNEAACRFYEACGFAVEGRSELDDNGRPYPLLHMRMRSPSVDRL